MEKIFNRLAQKDENLSHSEVWKIIYNITNSVIVDYYRMLNAKKREGLTLSESELNGIGEENNNNFENLVSAVVSSNIEISELGIRFALLSALKEVAGKNDKMYHILFDIYNLGKKYKEVAIRNKVTTGYIKSLIHKEKTNIKTLVIANLNN